MKTRLNRKPYRLPEFGMVWVKGYNNLYTVFLPVKKLLKNCSFPFSVLFFFLLCLPVSFALSQNVGISASGSIPHQSAGLDVDFTDKGFLAPRLTTAQRDAITNPANGLIIFNTDAGCPNYYAAGSWYSQCGLLIGGVASLDCGNAVNTGSLVSSVAASGASSDIPYTGGNGGPHNGQTVNSTGVTGLTATLSAGNFATGNGTLAYAITGTPSSAGTASFALNIGGQGCVLNITVAFNCGTDMVTFTYRGSSVTYGTVVGANNQCWLDRNLGASQVATSSTNAASYGDLLQWGRGDDGHQSRSSSTTYTRSNTDNPPHGNFIIHGPSPHDWREPQNANLWQGAGGINNPCPNGWRLPTNAEWDAERLSWNTDNSAGAFNSPLKLTLAGRRAQSTGMLDNVNVNGYYWSSSTSGIYSQGLNFNTSSTGMYNDTRARGQSVRCIKD